MKVQKLQHVFALEQKQTNKDKSNEGSPVVKDGVCSWLTRQTKRKPLPFFWGVYCKTPSRNIHRKRNILGNLLAPFEAQKFQEMTSCHQNGESPKMGSDWFRSNGSGSPRISGVLLGAWVGLKRGDPPKMALSVSCWCPFEPKLSLLEVSFCFFQGSYP